MATLYITKNIVNLIRFTRNGLMQRMRSGFKKDVLNAQKNMIQQLVNNQ